MKFRNLVCAGIVSLSLSLNMVPSLSAVTDDGSCRRWAREYGIRYSGAWEMNLLGCVYSPTKGYYVPRSGYCDYKARYLANRYPYPREWELAQRNKYYYVCDATLSGRYYQD